MGRGRVRLVFMHPWHAEHGVDRALALRLVAATWPDLAIEPEHVGSGWDVDVWRFGSIAVRFPRRALGIGCVENEIVVLGHIADVLPLPVPRPLRIGERTRELPGRFYAHEWLPGTPVLRANLDDAALAPLAGSIGGFLRTLHALPLASLYAAGLRDDNRGDVARVAARGIEWLGKVALSPALAGAAHALLSSPPPSSDAPTTLVHGDCHAGNLLIDQGALSGVIDWGDCAAGDPAVDLAIGWSLVPASARGAFLSAYGAVSSHLWARARVNAVSRHGLALLAWGQAVGDATIEDWAIRSLVRSLD